MHEILFSTLLLLSAGNSVASIESWAKKVHADRERALELRGNWKPLTEGTNGFGIKGRNDSLLYEPLVET